MIEMTEYQTHKHILIHKNIQSPHTYLPLVSLPHYQLAKISLQQKLKKKEKKVEVKYPFRVSRMKRRGQLAALASGCALAAGAMLSALAVTLCCFFSASDSHILRVVVAKLF